MFCRSSIILSPDNSILFHILHSSVVSHSFGHKKHSYFSLYKPLSFCAIQTSITLACWTPVCLFYMQIITTYWHKEGTVICSAQLRHTVKEDRGHLLVLVLHKAKHLEGEPAHLTLAVFNDGCLRVLVTASFCREEWNWDEQLCWYFEALSWE